MSARPHASFRPLVLTLAAAISACISLPALAGVRCQLLDANGNDIGDGGADAGNDGGGQANATACGRGALATNAAATAFGQDAQATGSAATAIGLGSRATDGSAIAIGAYANASGPWAMAMGRNTVANNWGTIGFGVFSQATGLFSTSVGTYSRATGANSSAFGGFFGTPQNSAEPARFTQATGTWASAFGSAAHGFATEATALGSTSRVLAGADRSVALGSRSVATEADTVSLGHAATDLDFLGNAFGTELRRRVIHLADGIADSDAASVGQLRPFAIALGGGSTLIGGVLTAPSYTIQGGSYGNVGDAFAAVDARLSALQAGTGNGVAYDSPAQDAVTLAGANGTRIGNLADGVADTDAANLGQVQDGDAATLSAANSYTDSQIVNANAVVLNTANAYADAGDAATLSSANAHADAGDAQTLSDAQDYADAGDAQTLTAANAYTDQRFTELTGLSDSFDAYKGEVDDRFNQMDRRIDKMSAMSGAYAGMAMNTSGLAGKNRIGVGVGAQGGEQAMAVGYQRAIGNRASVSLGAAFGGGEKSVSAGAGFSW